MARLFYWAMTERSFAGKPERSAAMHRARAHRGVARKRNLGQASDVRDLLRESRAGELRLGPTDDAHEQEARRIASFVVDSRPEEPELSAASDGAQRTQIPLANCSATAASKPRPGRPVGRETSSDVRSLQGAGRPLPGAARRFFESRFGVDLGTVRVHTGPRAAQTARAINARAYTLGRDIVFGAGQFSTDSLRGQRLIAHELAHVLQQSPGPSSSPPVRAGASAIQREPAAAEAEAPLEAEEPIDEEFAAELAAIEGLLEGRLKKGGREVPRILELLKHWGDPVVIAEAWIALGDKVLDRFLGKLTETHYAQYPLEITASVAAVPEGERAERIRRLANWRLGGIGAANASAAFFYLLAIEPSHIADVATSEARRNRARKRDERRARRKDRQTRREQARQERRERAQTRRATRESRREPSEKRDERRARSAAREASREQAKDDRETRRSDRWEDREARRNLVVARREDKFAKRIAAKLPRAVRYAIVRDLETEPDVGAQREGVDAIARAAVPNELTEPHLARLEELVGLKRPNQAELLEALDEFDALLELQTSGEAGSGNVIRTAVLKLEEAGALGPWLETLFASDTLNSAEDVTARVLAPLLSQRPLTLVQVHITDLLGVGRPAADVPASSQSLAAQLLLARSGEEQAQLREFLRWHPAGDLHARLPPGESAVQAIAAVANDDWLFALLQASQDDAVQPWDVLERLAGDARYNEGEGEADDEADAGLPLRPTGRDLARDVAALDGLGAVDALLDAVLENARNEPELGVVPVVRRVLLLRDASFNAATARRLVALTEPTGPQAHLVYEVLKALPADHVQALYTADAGLESMLKAALPASVRASTEFGPELALQSAAAAMAALLRDAALWEPAPAGDGKVRLQGTTRSLLGAMIQAGAGELAAEIATHFYKRDPPPRPEDAATPEELEEIAYMRWMDPDLRMLGLLHADDPNPHGSVWVYEPGRQETVIDTLAGKPRIGGPDVKLKWGLKGLPLIEHLGWKGIPLERLLESLSRDYSIWIELGEERIAFEPETPPVKSENSETDQESEKTHKADKKKRKLETRAPFGFTLQEGLQVRIGGPGFSIAQIDAWLQGMIVRIGRGRVSEWSVTVRREGEDKARVAETNAQFIEIEDLFFGQQSMAINIGRLALTQASASGDIAENVKDLPGKLLAGLDLFFAIQDGMFTFVNMIAQSITQSGAVAGSKLMASDLLMRARVGFQSRLAASAIEVDGLVLSFAGPQGGAVMAFDSISAQAKESPWGFQTSTASGAESWDELLALRVKRDRGQLNEQEKTRLIQLEEDALELVFGATLEGVSIEGLRLAVTSKQKVLLQTKVKIIAADRIEAEARIDALPQDEGSAALDFDASGDVSPLEALRAAGNNTPDARLMKFQAIIDGLDVVDEPDAERAQGAEAEQSLLMQGLHFTSPLGGLSIDAQSAGAGQLTLRVLQDVALESAQDTSTDRFAGDRHKTFPDPLAGDRLVHAKDVTLGAVTLSIDDVPGMLQALAPQQEGAESFDPHDAYGYLHELEGNIGLVVRVPRRGADPLELQPATARIDRPGKVEVRGLPGGVRRITIKKLFEHYDRALDVWKQATDFYEDAKREYERLRDRYLPTADTSDAEAARQAAALAAQERALAEARQQVRDRLNEELRELTVEAIKKWLEDEGFAHVEVTGTGLSWLPSDYDGNVRTLHFDWGEPETGIPFEITAVLAKGDAPSAVEVKVKPFALPMLSGHLGSVYYAGENFHLDAAVTVTAQLLSLAPDKLRVQIDDKKKSMGLEGLWILAQGSEPPVTDNESP
jgi:hypothetical protein